MSQSILKPILFGTLFGALAFLMPFFLLKVLFFFLIAGVLFRVFARRRFGPHGGGYHLAFADRIRNMSDEEYAAFKNRYQHCRGRYGWQEPQTPASDNPAATKA